MIIVNSKSTPSYQSLSHPHPFSTGYSSRKQYDSIKQLQNQEELSIIQWIKENFAEHYTRCKHVQKIQDLFDGIALAQIVSTFLSDEEQKQNFLNQIELVQKLDTKKDVKIARNNLNSVIQVVREMFALVYENSQSLVKKDKNNMNLVKLAQISIKSLQSFNGQNLIQSKNKMKNFLMQIIMTLPEISITLGQQKTTKLAKVQKQNIRPLRTESNTNNSRQASQKHRQYQTQAKRHNIDRLNYQHLSQNCNNIQQLSSIMGYSTVRHNQKTYFSNIHLHPIQEMNKNQIKKSINQRQFSQPAQDHSVQKQNVFVSGQTVESERNFQKKVEKLLAWIQSTYKINVSQLMQPQLLLGELVNRILAPNRLNDNEKPIKPTHYQLGSYSVYKKALDLLAQIERLNKSNLIALMKQVEAGTVKETTYWSLIEDIHSMVLNKVSEPLTSRRRPQSKQKSVKKVTQQSQKIPTEYDENINIDNIRSQSVTELLKQKEGPTANSNKLKDAPSYAEQLIRQTQLWLQNEMGMGHPLNKSKPSSKTTLYENPLFNGTLFAKIIQRLKIGAAKGVLTPLDQKQLKSNMDVVKNELLNRGYEVVRKLNIYRLSYNFYLGLLSQIREIHSSKQSNTKRKINDDKQKRVMEQAQNEIPLSQRAEVEKWLMQEFREIIQQINGIKQISLRQIKMAIEGVVKLNFLKQTTEKIRLLNYKKLLQFFRSIGFSHYSPVKVEDVVSDQTLSSKKTQNLRWMILRDLRIIKGDQSSSN